MIKIMVATDFSERSDRALRRATLLARQSGASLELIHVVDDDQPHQIVEAECKEAEILLHQLAATLQEIDGIPCTSRVMLAAPFLGIVQAVDDSVPDLLVIGPHRKQLLRDVFIGTTAERTIRSVACPTLMSNAVPAGTYRRVLLTTDLSAGSRDALRRFSGLRLGKRAHKSLLYVFDAPALDLAFSHTIPQGDQQQYLAEKQKEASQRLAEFLASLKQGTLESMVRYEATDTAGEIINTAREEQADLLVLSTRGSRGAEKKYIGSVTEYVLGTSSIDVLAIPPLHSEQND